MRMRNVRKTICEIFLPLVAIVFFIKAERTADRNRDRDDVEEEDDILGKFTL